MLYTIQAGDHYSRPHIIRPVLNKRHFCYNVCFLPDCTYDHPGTYDDEDINKLFGVGWGHHHISSARFGWTWNAVVKKIGLFAYCYVQGKRVSKFICALSLDEPYRLELYCSKNSYIFGVYDSAEKIGGEVLATAYVDKHKHFPIGYTLGPYFGGNLPAPHTMNINLW